MQQMAHNSAFLSFMMKAKFLAYFLDSKIAISKLIFSVLPNNQWDLKQEYQNRKKKKKVTKSHEGTAFPMADGFELKIN